MVVDVLLSARRDARRRTGSSGMAELEDGDYELRWLKVNALYLIAAWVVGPRQLVLPLEPAPHFMEARRLYSADAFQAAMHQPDVQPFIAGPAG
jgi:hypothetical protein